MSSLEELKSELFDEFAMFESWMEKYEYIIELGKELPLLNEDEKTEDNLVKGCQSRVWLISNKEGDRVYFKAESDAIISKGLISLLLRIYSGQPAEEIIKDDAQFLKDIGLSEHLSPNRSNGLSSMLKKIKAYALAHTAKQ